jgi:hypothetical protein
MKPKKILHVANRAEKHLGKKFYSLPFKINNGFVRNGHNVYWFSDRDVAKNASLIPSAKFGRVACNRKLIEVCRNFCPEIIVLAHADLINLETLLEIKAFLPGVLIFQYNIDGLFAKGNIEKILGKTEVCDFTFMTTAGSVLKSVSQSGCRTCFIPNPVDASIDVHCNWRKNSFDYDLFFIGARSEWVDPDSMRAQALKNLPDDPFHVRSFVSANLWGSALMNVAGVSKMGLCFSQRPSGERAGEGGTLYLGSSDRISLCMGNGLLTFTDKKFNLADLYGTDALVEVESYEEFRDKVAYFMKHDKERIRVARAGYEISHREFNEVLVSRFMLETVCNQEYSRSYAWPTTIY